MAACSDDEWVTAPKKITKKQAAMHAGVYVWVWVFVVVWMWVFVFVVKSLP